MIQVEANTLTDVALDWAVANCEGLPVRRDPMGFGSGSEAGYWVWNEAGPSKQKYMLIGREYSPSTKWDQGGIIIDKLQGILSRHQFLIESDGPNVHIMAWLDKHTCIKGYGPTLLIAAMRCYVAACKGETIELPVSLAP